MTDSNEDEGDFVRAKRRIGQVLRGKYRIDRVIGVGGMAAVYAATHRNQKQFAVKILHTELSFRDDIRTRFLREGYAANSVKHPGAVAVLDDDVAEDGAAFLVMELLEGASVEELSERAGGRLAAAYVLSIGHQLLETLGAAHEQGIVHRDIKPANLFVTREGQLKVLDFGIARVRDAATSGAHATGTGMLLGTPAFMAPEQAMGRSNEIDGQTDLWAVGATLFTLLSGHLVHPGETGPHLMVLAATTPARSLAIVAPDVPRPIVAAVDRALGFVKADRWPTAHAMRDALRDASLAIFGRLPLRETLLPVFGDGPSALAQTRPAHSVVAARPVAEFSAAAATAPAGFAPVLGMTTAQPVSAESEPIPSRPAGVPRSRPGLTVAIAVAAVLLAAAGTAIALRTAAPASPSADTAGKTATSTPSSAPPPAVELLPAPVTPLPSIERSEATVATASTASSTARTGRSQSAATPARVRPTEATSGPTPSPLVPPPPAPATTPGCHVVSFFDADGNKHFRQECH